MKTSTLIAWAPNSRRLSELSSLLGGSVWKTSILFRVKASAPIKYALQAFKTLVHLRSTMPKLIVVQNPPVFAPLACMLYARLKGGTLLIDHHCVWNVKNVRTPVLRRIIRALESYCCRSAHLNIVPNNCWAAEIRRMNREANVLTLVDFVDEGWLKGADITVRERMFPKHRWLMVAPCGGNPLERPDIAVRAAAGFQDLALAVTGWRKYLKKHVREAERLKLQNVYFTDHLPEKAYRGLMATCDAVINITDEPFTVPHFICEALAAGKPVVSTPNPAVKSILAENAVYVKRNDVESLKEALQRLLENYGHYASRARKAYERLKRMRREQEKALKKFLEANAKRKLAA